MFKAASPLIATEDDALSFELVGLDFMVDEDLQVYLIEVNKNPCLSTLSAPQHGLISQLLRDTLGVAVDPLFKLKPKVGSLSANKFELVHVHLF